jgi:hypothetical protein
VSEAKEIGAEFDDARKSRYLQWLLTPKGARSPATQNGIAEELGVSARTLRDWNQHEEFRKVWKREAAKFIARPDDIQEVLDALKARALDPTSKDGVSAAKEWLSRVQAPDEVEKGTGAKSLSELSTEELMAIAAVKAQVELQTRNVGLSVVANG